MADRASITIVVVSGAAFCFIVSRSQGSAVVSHAARCVRSIGRTASGKIEPVLRVRGCPTPRYRESHPD